MIKRQRKCPECFSRGITITFETGNQLKQHRRARHPKTAQQMVKERQALKEYRRTAILALRRVEVD